MKKTNLKEVLEKGTPKQKALLIIKSDEESQQLGGRALSEAEVKAIIRSVEHNQAEKVELNRYLRFAEVYSLNRFRIYGLHENLYKFGARIAAYLLLWEQAEREAELFNTILGLMDTEGKKVAAVPRQKEIEDFIYKRLKKWNRYIHLNRRENSREVEVELSTLKAILENEIINYTHSVGVAKAIVAASDEFIGKYRAMAFVPEDIKKMLSTFRNPTEQLPDLYRRDTYLKLLREKGADDREVKYREKYAIIPAFEEIAPIGLEDFKEAFKL